MKKITFLLLALFLQTAIIWALPAKSSLGPHKVAKTTTEMPKSISELLFSAVVQNDAILTSAPGTNAQVVCQGNSITTISYVTFGATGMGTPVGLPAGVTAVFTPMTGTYNSVGFINITGTPSVLGTFNYSIPLTGGTGVAVFATGSITINRTPAAATSLSSNSPLCEGGQLNLLAQGAIFSGSYSMLDNSGDAFIDIAETGTNVPGSLEDDSKHTIEIPTFNYYGQNYNSATVSANGIIIFGNVATGDYYSNRSLPSAFYASGYTYVAPYWDDLLPGQTSSIKTQTVGDNFIIQYTVLGFFDSNSQPITFQVQLNLVTGAIVFVYSNVETGNAATTNGQSATVGIQKNTTTAVQYSYNTASLSNGKSISFTPVYVDALAWTGPNGFSSNLLNPTIPNATAAASGNYQFQMISSQGCASAASTLPVTITPVSLLLSSGSETTNQTVSYGSAITPIVYTTNGTITVEGLPPGLSAVSTNNSLVIAGTPTGNGSYQYTLTGSTACNNIATGTFNLVPLLLNSALSTVDQTVCQGTIITPIVYSGNVSQAVVNGLPDGVTASIDGNTITFSGAPATAGNYTYAIALDGVINEGMIAVKSLPATPTITSSGATTICEGSSVTLSASVAAVVEPIDNLSGALLATGLHKIVSSYTGPALRLRRDGDNAEQDFGFVGNDLDVNAINEWLNGTNGYCTTLYDQTGHNGNITQNDMGSQPQFVASGLNNRPILHFNTGHYMFNEVAYPTNFSVVYGAKITGTSSRVLSARHNNWLLGYWGGQMDLAHFDGWIGGGNTGVPSNNAFNIYAGNGNGMVSTIYKNGTQLFSGSEGLTAPNGIQINQHQDNGERSDVDFTDIMIYDTELSGQDVGKVNNFIAGYYGGALTQSTNNFAWSTNENTTQIEVSTAGEYSVRTLGGNGCLSAPSAVTSVSVIAAPTVIAPENQTYCDGTVTAAIALVGTPSDVTFTIQNGAAIGLNDVTGVTAIPSFTPISGTATVYITPFGNGCTGTPVPFTITVNKTLFNLTASANVVCLDAPVTISAHVTSQLSYCNAINSEAGTTYCKITYVGFGSIDNDTSNDISSDTIIHPAEGTTTTVVQPGEAYLLNVSSTNALADVGVWIDYNRNGSFESTEYTEVYQDNEAGTVNITIPNDATIGQTRMRVRSEYYQFDRVNSNASCDTFSYGTTQDYTITIGQDFSDNTISWSSDTFDVSVSNATTASVTTNPSVTTTYIATVTSATTGCSTTNAITVIAQNGVIINEQPVAETTVCEGANASFSVEATGAGLTYQWFKDGQPLTDGAFVYGAQTNVLSLGQLPINYNGVYTVKVDSQCGEFVVSEGAILNINPFPMLEPIANQTYCSGTVTAAIPLLGTPNNVFYNISGGEAIGLADTMGVTAIPAFTAVAGTATITVTPLANGCTGFPVTYAVTVNKTPIVSLGASASIVCSDTSVTVLADINPYYYCSANTYNTYFQRITHVTFGSIDNDTSNDRSTTNIIHPFSGSTTTVVQPGETYPLTVNTINNPADVGAWIDYNRNGIYEASEYTEVFQDAYTGTVNITIPNDAAIGKTGMRIRSEFWQDNRVNFYAPCSQFTYGTTHDYTITIGQDVTDNTISWSSNPVDISLSNVNTPSISTIPAATTTYTATVTSLAGCTATASTTVIVQNEVIIYTQPEALITTCQGVNTAFSIAATGVELTYQWYKEGQPLTNGGTISGATSATLNILEPTPNDNGVYTVMVHPLCGDDVFSTMATLMVNPTPTVEPIANQTYCAGSIAAVSIDGSPSNVTYAISGGSTIGLNDVEGVTAIPAFTAVAGTATITVTPSSNGCTGQPTTFAITVNARPIVALTSSATTATCPGSSVSISAAIAYTEPIASYCNSYNGYTGIFGITNVTFATLNSDTTYDQLSGPNTHQEMTVVQPGETYSLSVNTPSFNDLPSYVGAWIDYNRNGIYEASEYTEVINGSVSISIPMNASIGKTGMRVRSDIGFDHFDSQYDSQRACEYFEYGSTQDYTITIGEELPAYTISWSSEPVDESLSNVHTASITPSPAVTTTYTASVTPASGCATTSSMVVEVLPAIAIAEHPASTYICSAVGSTALFTAATNTAATSYTWQYRVVTTANPNPAWITITSANAGAVYSKFTTENLVVTKTATLPAAGTQYRVKVTDACNSSATSNVAMLSIITTVKAGTITAPASVCLGGDMTLVVSGYSGTSLQWQSAASATAPFANIAGATSDTYTIYGATADVNKSYRVIVSNSCNATSATTAVKTIVVNPTTVAGTITGAGTVCTGGGATLKLVSNVGTAIQWKYSTDGVSYTNVPTTTLGTATSFATTSTSGITATYIVTNVTQSTWFKATVKSGLCNTEETAPVQVIVGTTVEGIIGLTQGFSNTICSGTATSLTLSGHTGTIAWSKSINNGITWTAVTGTTATISTGVLANTTLLNSTVLFRAIVTLGTCGSLTAVSYPVNVLPAAKGGTVAVNDTSLLTVCSGGSKTLKVTGYIGSIQWQKSTTSGTAGFVDVPDAITTPYTFDAIAQNTWFRVVAKNGDCLPTALSNAIAITVSTPVAVGTITAAANDLCPTNTGTTLTLAGHVGTISWAKSTDNGNTWTTVTGTAATLATGVLPVTTIFRAKLTSGSCFDYSSILVMVKLSTTATVSATASTICSGLTTTVTVANYGLGTIQWQKATTLTGTYANVTTGTGITSATYVTPALTATTYFRALITDKGCSSGTTGYGVTVSPLAVAKTITGTVTATTAAAAICTSASQTLTMASGSVGTIQWQWSNSIATTSIWTDIPNANGTTLQAANYVPVPGATPVATYFRVKMTNSCSTAGVYSAAIAVFYKNCTVLKSVVVKEEFKVIAYPNPYSENFNLSLTTTSIDKVDIMVYDMIGKLIEKRAVSPSEVSGLQVGDRYPSGVYNVVITQGAEVRTLRVIKR